MDRRPVVTGRPAPPGGEPGDSTHPGIIGSSVQRPAASAGAGAADYAALNSAALPRPMRFKLRCSAPISTGAAATRS
jgi:hypothetical protein